MRAALLVLFVMVFAADARSDSLPWTHTRAMSPAALHLLQLATERSSLVRGLVEDLERTDVVVLLTFSNEPGMENRRAFMTFLTVAAGIRYVAVQLYWRPEPLLAQVPLIAHELQHALELAAAPDVRDQESCARLFARIGWPAGPQRFETEAARVTEGRVRRELRGNAI